MFLNYDILYYISDHYLHESPSTIASLTLTARGLNDALQPIKYRSIKLKLRTFGKSPFDPDSDSTAKEKEFARDVQSPAERLATKLLLNPWIIDQVKYLWIGNSDLTRYSILPSLEDLVCPRARAERNSLYYVLTCRFPALKELTFSVLRYTREFSKAQERSEVRNVFPSLLPINIPPDVWKALRMCAKRPSLSRISLLTSPFLADFFSDLSHISSITAAGEPVYQKSRNGHWTLANRRIKCRPVELEIQHGAAIEHIGNHTDDMPPWLDLSCLTTLILKDLPSSGLNNDMIADFIRPSLTTLSVLKVLYQGNCMVNGHTPLLILRDAVSLKSLTLALDYPSSGPVARRSFRLFVSTIAACVSNSTCLESVTLLFSYPENPVSRILTSYREWFYLIDKDIWASLDALLSAGPVHDHYGSGLQRVHIGFLASKMTADMVEFLRRGVKARLPKLVTSGRLDLVVEKFQGSSLSHALWGNA